MNKSSLYRIQNPHKQIDRPKKFPFQLVIGDDTGGKYITVWAINLYKAIEEGQSYCKNGHCVLQVYRNGNKISDVWGM